MWSIFAVPLPVQEAVRMPNPSARGEFVAAAQFLSEEHVWVKWKKTAAFRIQVNMC